MCEIVLLVYPDFLPAPFSLLRVITSPLFLPLEATILRATVLYTIVLIAVGVLKAPALSSSSQYPYIFFPLWLVPLS
jgi:hypothetical protein